MTGKRKPNLGVVNRQDVVRETWDHHKHDEHEAEVVWAENNAGYEYRYTEKDDANWQVIFDALGKPAEPTIPKVEAAINYYNLFMAHGEATLTLTETKKAMKAVAKTAGKLMLQLDDLGATGAAWLGDSVDLEQLNQQLDMVRYARPPKPPGGRPDEAERNNLIVKLADIYNECTGEPPVGAGEKFRPRGPFLGVVIAVFALAGIGTQSQGALTKQIGRALGGRFS